MAFVPTLDVDAHAGRIRARELVRRVERLALVASEAGVPAQGIGAGLLHAASAPAWSTALVGV